MPGTVLADDDHVVALTTTKLSKGDERFEGKTFFVFHVDGGKVSETWIADVNQQDEDEFWANVS